MKYLFIGMTATILLSALNVVLPVGDAQGIEDLVEVYGDHLVSCAKNNTLCWRDGTEMTYDDGINETAYEEMLENASLKDQMSQDYPLAWPKSAPSSNCDPGRARNEAFFRKMYGDTPARVESMLVSVSWFNGKSIRATSTNGVSKALGQVRDRLSRLSPEVHRYVASPSGGYCWRTIKGASRLSMHSYGAAIDFEFPREVNRYWRWDRSEKQPQPEYPVSILEDETLKEIVAVFEEAGFIWGGKWFHYDTMHFEFRPELVLE